MVGHTDHTHVLAVYKWRIMGFIHVPCLLHRAEAKVHRSIHERVRSTISTVFFVFVARKVHWKEIVVKFFGVPFRR